MNRRTACLLLPVMAAALLCLTGYRNPPGSARLVEMGDKALMDGHREEALGLYTRAIELGTATAETYLSRAFLLLKLNRKEDALRDFTSYIDREPGKSQGYVGRGMLLSELGREQDAQADFAAACRLGDPAGCSFAAAGKKGE